MSYTEIKELVDQYLATGHTLPCTAQNSDGENIIVSKGETSDSYRTDTFQSNGWIRINEYYSDGTTTETYER